MKLAKDIKSFWESIMFMNYIQFMLPHMQTEKGDLSERDYEVFSAVLQSYKPDIIIVWGAPVGNAIKDRGQKKTRLAGADINYLFKQQINGRENLFVNCYHPSNLFGKFTNDSDNLARQLHLIL